ncbi:DEAD/DEAH box helicase [Sinomonas humi]|uniref:DEAD/DEAH box helicase n=1 Tax=Sinomonas humi TaxID=1338436 RepID=UPI00068A1599|nr:DEAD/DEAH box helicase [Sinomonas humi]
MERDERERLRGTSEEATRWLAQARSVQARRSSTEKAGDEAVAALRRRTVDVRHEGQVAWRVLPLRPGDEPYLGCTARHAQLPRISPEEREVLDLLTTDVASAIDDAKAVIGLRRFFLGGRKREAGAGAAAFLNRYREWAHSAGLPQLLVRLGGQDGGPSQVPVEAALADWVGLGRRLADLGASQHLLAVAAPAQLSDAIEAIDAALRREERFRADAIATGEAVRKHEVRRLLSDMPVERLKEATRDRLRIGPLTDARLNTVQAVLDRGNQLAHLPGIGQTSATRMLGAARTLWQMTHDETPVRIDIKDRTAAGTELLRRLAAWDAIRSIKGATTDLALKESLVPVARALDGQISHLAVLASDRSVEEFTGAVEAVIRRARQIPTTAPADEAADPWEDFFRRPADYFAMLSELGFVTEDEQKAHGDLPDDIVEAVRSLELDTQHLSASLRGYQSFGARFALVQGKVIIGDEMGLGKTVEALAVLAHLRSKGAHHSLVICPAAVVTNWVREVRAKSRLRPYRLHGPGRDAAALGWVRSSGVAVTTFETLLWVEPYVRMLDGLGCVVVDEAHYVKNPATQRARRVARIIDLAERTVLLTGTPLENRIDEFRTLVGYIRPDLAVDGSGLSPKRFRRQVAPAYLRRNQEDVLTELPELVEVEEWLPFSAEDEEAYFDAVVAGNFMAMRRAAMASGTRSGKMQRLVEIVQEAEDNRRRVIVFSQFRDVLDRVAHTLPGEVYGPLTGSVPAAARQAMVDQFSVAGHGAVLVSQIVAGGIGLNIQAASVVVICEPQLKPTTEWQAIARARRMGQLESVQVHRLLSEEGVDRRVTEILARKQQLFDDFARVSETADSAPEAFDISEAELARDIVAAEKERLLAQPPTGSASPEPSAAIPEA